MPTATTERTKLQSLRGLALEKGLTRPGPGEAFETATIQGDRLVIVYGSRLREGKTWVNRTRIVTCERHWFCADDYRWRFVSHIILD